MQRNTKRLQQRTDIQTHILRQLIAPLGRVVDPLLQRALEMRESLATASELHVFANVVAALGAAGTTPAWQADFESNFVAGLEAGDIGADRSDYACRFVAEGERLADEDVAVAVVGVVVEVAAAEAGGGNADLKFVCLWGLKIAGFLEIVC